jgi:molybdopterin synthase sulfur carrier subunit
LSFTANLQRHLRCEPQEVCGATVREVLEAACKSNPKLRSYVLEDDGSLRKHMNIFLNGQQIEDRIRLSDSVAENDELYVMQALSGG